MRTIGSFWYFRYIALSSSTRFIFFQFLFIFFVFHFLSQAADVHLAPSLTFISRYLKLSQTLAGFNLVTLIALSNGAPDVMTAVVASGSDSGILIAVGSVFGAGLFITTVVLGKVIYLSRVIKNFQVNRTSINRDVIFNLIASSVIIVFALMGYINYIMSMSFFLLYIAYIFVVLYNEKQANIELQEIKQKLEQEQIQQKQINQNEDANEQDTLLVKQPNDEQEQLANDLNVVEQQKVEAVVEADILPKEEEKEWREMNIWERMWFCYAKPLEYLRRLTIPCCTEEQWDKQTSLLHCLLTPIALLYLTGYLFTKVFGIYLIFYFWGVSFVFGLLTYYLTESHEPPKHLIFYVVCGTFLSILWTKLCVEIMVDFLILVQILTGLSYSYIGMTFLAYGNSAGDYLVNTQIASLGYGLMALTGCFAGSIFNLLVGFGGAMIRKTWFEYTIYFPLFYSKIDPQLVRLISICLEILVQGQQMQTNTNYLQKTLIWLQLQMNSRMNNAIAYTLLMFQMVNLSMTLVIVRVKKYNLTTPTANYYWIFYIIFFLLITTIFFTLDATIDYLRPG